MLVETKVTQIEKTKEIFAARLNLLKGDMNLSELEKETKISRQTLNKYLNCIALPNSDSLIVLADTFNVSCDYLLGRDEGTEHDVDYIMKETGLSENAINRLKEFNSDKFLKLEIFAINKFIEFSGRGRFWNLLGSYISSTNIDEENRAWYQYVAFVKSNLFFSYTDNEEGQESTRISREEFAYHLVNREFRYLVERLKKNENTKRDIKNHLKEIVLSYFKEQEEKSDFIDYKKIDDDEGLANAIKQYYVSIGEKRRN